MAVDLSAYHTLVEFANRHKHKMLLDIIKSTKQNPLMTDSIWREANDLTKHTFTRAVSYPTASVRLLNKGAVPNVGQTQPYDEPVRSFENHVNIDEKYEKLEKNFAQYRYSEELLHLEGFSRTFMEQFLYGDPSTTLGEIEGLFTRYNDPSSQDNVHDEGSTTDDQCSSALMVKWGGDGLFLTYPQGDKNHGINREPRGKVLLVTDSTTGAQAWFWNTVFTLDFGLCAAKDVAVQRLGSIDSSNTVDPDNLVTMATNIYEEYGSYENVFLYVNGTVFGQMWKENNATPGLLTPSGRKDPWGNPVWAFNGIPVRLMGGLKNTEDDI